MRTNILKIGLVTLLATLVMAGAGCRRDQGGKKYKGPFEGVAEKINVETGEVSMKISHEAGMTINYSGYVNDKTQVEINGVVGRIEDIHQGDPVKVTGYNELVGDTKRFIVTRISVHRADNAWIKVGPSASSAPASKTAD